MPRPKRKLGKIENIKASFQKMKQLYLDGWAINEISRGSGLHQNTIRNYIKAAGGLTTEDKITHLRNREKLFKEGKVKNLNPNF